MKNYIPFILLLLLMLTAIFFLIRRQPPLHDSPPGPASISTTDRERSVRFWQAYREATRLRISGRLEEAEKGYREALVENPAHEDALYYLGNVQLALGNYSEALANWQQLVKVNPASARAHLQLGDLYIDFGKSPYFDPGLAESEFIRAREINREASKPLLRLGQIELIKGNLHGALAHLEAVSGFNDDISEAYYLIGYICWKGGNTDCDWILLKSQLKPEATAETKDEFSREGNTKKGVPMLQKNQHSQNPLLSTDFQDLATLDSNSFINQLEKRYRLLDAYLLQIALHNPD